MLPFNSTIHQNKQNSSDLSVTTNSYPFFSSFALELQSRLLEAQVLQSSPHSWILPFRLITIHPLTKNTRNQNSFPLLGDEPTLATRGKKRLGKARWQKPVPNLESNVNSKP